MAYIKWRICEYTKCVHRSKNACYLVCTIVPMHTLDSLFEKCPNFNIRVLLLIWLWGRVIPPREIAVCSHCLFLLSPLSLSFFLLFSSFFSFVFLFFVLVEQFVFLSDCSIFLWYGFGMGRLFFFLFFFFPKLVVTFFVYCYGIVIVLNFLLIRPRSHYWTFYFFKRKICQQVAYKWSATPILKPCQI